MVYENGALAEDAKDEMIEEMGNKFCPNKNCLLDTSYEDHIYCDTEKCAVFHTGEIDHDGNNENYKITVKPHCGLTR